MNVLVLLLSLFHLFFVAFQPKKSLILACEVSRLVVSVVQLRIRFKYLKCPSAERLPLSSFGDFPHNKHFLL